MNLFALLFISSSLAASAQDIGREPKKPAADAQLQEQAVSAAAAAQKKVEAAGEDVTYEQVLASPDDVDLNYRFARTQVRKGNVKGASATLERILLLKPGLTHARLFHAIVLFRLDNLAEAKRELDILKKQGVPPALKMEVDSYTQAIEKRTKRNRLTGRISAGFEYDTNRNASPSRGLSLFADNLVHLNGSSLRRDDTAVLFICNVEGRRDLGTQAGHEAFVNLTHYRSEQTLLKTLNLQAYSAAGGLTLKRRGFELTPSLLFDHVLLAQSTFLRNRGASLRLQKKFHRTLDLFLETRSLFNDYSNTPQAPAVEERNGVQVDVTAGAAGSLTPSMRLSVSLTHLAKHASRHYNAFFRDSLKLNHSWLLGKGTFLLSSIALGYDQYDQADAAISTIVRRDKTLRAGATYGAPLKLLHPTLKDFVWTLGYEYFHSLSNIKNYSYTNDKVSTLLTYRWELGF